MTKRIVNNLRREDGWVVVTAVIVMSLMMGIGLATYATVDTQQAQSRVERERDSSFNLSESALYAEAFILGQDWPTLANPYPLECTEATSDPRGCPTATDLQNAVDSQALPDLSSGAQWTIRVRDNGSPTGTDYDSTTEDEPPYDANGDGKLWVRADAVAKGRTRSIVGLMQREKLGQSVAQNVITAGRFYTSNAGNKVVVDTQGNSATGSQVVVRCIPGPDEPEARSECTGYDQDQSRTQVSPDRVYSVPTTPNAMTDAQVESFKKDAIANRTYFTSCPPSLSGKIVFIDPPDNSTVNCGDDENYRDAYNSAASPGTLIITNGTLELSGNQTIYYGFVYMLNRQQSSGDVVTVHANATLQGGVAVDGNGAVRTGSDKVNIIFDGQAFISLETHGSAGLVQNSWRELTPGS
jgi:Tfp pilus assembly protein PilX